jgi:chromosomal replication initiator protein
LFLNSVWSNICEEIAKKIQPQYFEPFIKPLVWERTASNVVYVKAPNSSVKSHVTTKYKSAIEEAILEVLGDYHKLEVSLPDEPSFTDTIKDSFQEENSLNSDYSFDNYIISQSNKVAYTAALDVISNPGSINPLYIYGGVGVGKTHLLHAIAKEIKNREPWKTVRYIDTTSFMNEFIFTVRQNNRISIESFKNKFQSYNVLIMDDIQFLNSGADKTQEEFFSLFNFLYDRKRQIIIASDRPSVELPIQERLKSRFVTGFQVDIKSPDLSLRKQILNTFCNRFEIQLHESQREMILSRITEDNRSLIGLVNDLYILKKSFGLLFFEDEQIQSAIQSRLPRKFHFGEKDIDSILDRICLDFKISRKDLLGKRRTTEFVFPRHLSMYVLSKKFNLGKSEIGRIFDSKHSSVIHAITKMENQLHSETKHRDYLEQLYSEFFLQ